MCIRDRLYTFLFRPISKGYELILPRPVRKGIDNAFENVKYPVRVVNCTLQGKFKRAGQETGKFVVNTVGGVAGIFRPAENIPALANVPDEDTAQTLGKWGIPNGPYLVLPLLGPSSVRDTVGLAGDYALNPVNWPYLYWFGSRSKPVSYTHLDVYKRQVFGLAFLHALREFDQRLASLRAAVEHYIFDLVA